MSPVRRNRGRNRCRGGQKAQDYSAQTNVEQYVHYSYACCNCGETDIETPVVKASYEKGIIPNSFATAEAIAHIMTRGLSWIPHCTARNRT